MIETERPGPAGEAGNRVSVPKGIADAFSVPPDDNAERALLSCLLHLDPARVVGVVGKVGPDDLGSPVLAELLAAIAALAAVGIAPEPAAVVSLLRQDGRANGERLHAVTLLLADLYGAATVPASAGWFAARVLEEATRRRAREAGERIAEAAERVPIADLPDLVTREAGAVLVLAERASAAGGTP